MTTSDAPPSAQQECYAHGRAVASAETGVPAAPQGRIGGREVCLTRRDDTLCDSFIPLGLVKANAAARRSAVNP